MEKLTIMVIKMVQGRLPKKGPQCFGTAVLDVGGRRKKVKQTRTGYS